MLQSFFGGAGHRDGSRQGYVPTRSGEDGDMRMQALSLNGFSAYDPPPAVVPMPQQQTTVERHALVDLGPVKPENERRASMNKVWSGDTRVGDETVKKGDEVCVSKHSRFRTLRLISFSCRPLPSTSL